MEDLKVTVAEQTVRSMSMSLFEVHHMPYVYRRISSFVWTLDIWPVASQRICVAFGAPLMLTVLAGWRCAEIVISLMRLMLVAMALRPIWPCDTSLFLLRFSDSLLSHDSNVGVAVFDPSLPVTTFRNGRYMTS